jgi:hypothetical protein
MSDAAALRCNFFGIQYDATITLCVNEMPTAVKTPTAFVLQSDSLFVCPLIEVPPKAGYSNGQKSRIGQASKWQLQEGQYHAEILRDYTDLSNEFLAIANTALRQATALLKGRVLKFEGMYVTLQASNPSVENRILRLDTEFFLSENTRT